MAPRLRKNSFFVDRKAKNGDFAKELKEKLAKIKVKPMKPIRPKKATHFKVEKVKLKSVTKRKLQPTPPKQKNMFEKMVEQGIAFRNAKEAKKIKESETNIDYASLQIKRIHGATNFNGKLQFLIEWENSKKYVLIDAAVTNKHFTQEVIKFYQQRVTFV